MVLPPGDERLAPDQLLKDAFEDKALVSLRHVKSWKIVEEKDVHNLPFPYAQEGEAETAAVIQTNVGGFVVLIDYYSGSARAAIFFKIGPFAERNDSHSE